MNETLSLGRAAALDLARRGFTRRQMLRVAALVGASTALPFGSERALAQLSNVGELPDDAVKINANEFPEGPSPPRSRSRSGSSTSAIPTTRPAP
jgi:hypothetical protein